VAAEREARRYPEHPNKIQLAISGWRNLVAATRQRFSHKRSLQLKQTWGAATAQDGAANEPAAVAPNSSSGRQAAVG